MKNFRLPILTWEQVKDNLESQKDDQQYVVYAKERRPEGLKEIDLFYDPADNTPRDDLPEWVPLPHTFKHACPNSEWDYVVLNNHQVVAMGPPLFEHVYVVLLFTLDSIKGRPENPWIDVEGEVFKL